MKKVLSLVLVIAMVLSSMSFAFADTFEDVTGDYEKAIDTLAGLGIIDGYEDGTFRPENIVTRAEMAKLMVEILGYGDLVAGAKSNFSDTQGHWADAWIAIAAGRNIVIGTGDGKFTPDRQVSYDEVLTMIVRGLGYTDDSNEIKSMTWPTNFKVKAAEIGLTQGVKMSVTGADRGGVAQALFNALEATLVTVDNEGNVRALQDHKQRDLLLISRIAIQVGFEDAPLRIVPEMLDPNHRDYGGDIVDLEPHLYEYVIAYATKADSDIIVYVGESFSDTVVGTFKADTDAKEVGVKLEDGTTKTLDLTSTSDNIEVYYNGKEVILNESGLEDGTNAIVALAETGVADVKVVLKDRYNDSYGDYTLPSSQDGDVKAIVVSNPTAAQRVVAGYRDGALKLGRLQLPKKGDKVDLTKVTVTGAVDDIEDIEKGDVVVAYAAGGADNSVVPSKTTLVVVRDTIEGKVTRVNKSATENVTSIYIDGVKYTRSEIPGRTEFFDVGYEGTFFLDDAGRIFTADTVSLAGAKDYAVVIDKETGYATDGTTSARILADAEVKLINASGEVVTYKVDVDAEYPNGDVLNYNVDRGDSQVINFLADGTKQLASGALIKYKVDDGKITDIEILSEDVYDGGVNGAGAGNDTNKLNTSTTSKSFVVTENVVIFNIDGIDDPSDDKDDYSVVKAENLPSSINIYYSEYTDGGEYKVIVSDNADRGITGTFALITNLEYVWEKDEKVAEVTAMVNGKEVVYLAKNDEIDVNEDLVDVGVITKLILTNGKISEDVDNAFADEDLEVLLGAKVATPAAVIANSKTGFYVSNVTGDRFRVKIQDDVEDVVYDLGWFTFDTDNIVVYELNSKDEFVEVGSIDTLIGFEIFRIYNVNNDEKIDIIVVK